MPNSDEFTLSQITVIGQLIQSLTVPPKTAHEADTTIDKIRQALEAVDLPHTSGVCEQLHTFQQRFLSRYSPTQELPSGTESELTVAARTILTALKFEASMKRALILDSSAVAVSLRNLTDQLEFLTETQLHLRREVIRCLECGAVRAAIVMAWNFAFDYIRHWVFSNHLVSFNQTLTTKYTLKKDSQPRYIAINEYSDFWESRSAPGERTVLETCESAGIIPRKVYDSLVESLRRRNDFAHSNSKTPDADLTKGYIADLLSVIMSDPFPKPKGT